MLLSLDANHKRAYGYPGDDVALPPAERMIMWAFEHTETTSATPDQLWARYIEPATWPQWDHGIAAVRPFRAR